MKKLSLLLLMLAGCSSGTGHPVEQVGLGAEAALPKRAGTVLVDGCVLDTWSRATLAQPATKRLVQEVVFLCLVPREDGVVGPRDPSAKDAFALLAADLKGEGYAVDLAVAFTDESGQRYDGEQTRQFLDKADYRQKLVDSLVDVVAPADGIEIDLQGLPNDAEPLVTDLVTRLASTFRPEKKLGVFVPPSVTTPSDLPGGDAFSRRKLGPLVDRMRIMTLDFSAGTPGPTIDSGWAVDAIRVAASDFAGHVDVSYPLYGTDFGPRGTRSVTWADAHATAESMRVPIARGPTGAPFLSYRAFGGEDHQLWFDDADSTGLAFGAWTFDVMPADVGVLYYGLGAEDPTLWDKLAARTQ